MTRRLNEWVSLREAARILDINTDTFLRKFAARFSQQRLEGMPIRYLRAEIEELLEASIVRAKPQ